MNTYTVIILGPRGSGKTVFLASMYNKLCTQGEGGFFLEVDSTEKSKQLHDLYTQIAFEEKWPSGTRRSEVSEWTFTCHVQTKDLPIYPACKFTYLDYSGGLLTEQTEEDDPKFDEQVKKADALLGLLDGQRLCALMRNEKLGQKWAVNEVSKLLSMMQKSGKPIHFVISKWDIVEKEYTLEQIRDCLVNEISHFKNLVTSYHKAGKPVRLIPVSAVGKDFATLQPDGSMAKNLRILPQPFQVEIPLACVLPDLIQADCKEAINKMREQLNRPVEVKANLSFWEQVGQVVGGGLKAAQEILPTIVDLFVPKKYAILQDTVLKMVDFASEYAEAPAKQKQEAAAKRAEELRQEKEELLKQVQNEETAFKYALSCFLSVQNELNLRFPESDLKLP
ncbi:TRAFAC clade GTPase domain-containing protein [Floridanema aerugineum]|uniref:Double-GTPase 2 domain-containing protein n=1 Tax=Floridaenema aerugineum BLCC-F46 TaxID=3153654 RepID=A0ABV4WYD5_9CYAN